MHQPIIGGSRRNPLPETPAPKPAKPEAPHAVPAHANETHAPHEEGQKTLTEAEVMALYYAHRGSCPLCGKVMKKGITGHLSKCLPIHNSRIVSTTTT